MKTENCNECGKSVKAGSGLFVNRVSDFNYIEDRKMMGKPFPEGEFICIDCDKKINANLKDAMDLESYAKKNYI